MSLVSRDCPRCSDLLERIAIRAQGGGGAYRELAGVEVTGYRCTRCGLGVVTGAVVAELMKRLSVGGGMSERERKPTRTACPGCMGNVDAVLLSWSTTFVEIEQCPRCRTMLLDAGEFPKVFVIEHSAKASV